ncbi:peptide ABC transporter ATP-binding protein [Magnetovibrio blakemorei]|uniref:Peptide ABC transporter ATP-binding protein n=2 Tax=Magnetovibrio blakemorei TaxID=28181 RepID=A0A1E5QA26_9PROT|nr:peptide ABC transporter ATP-binding protein [Magnetovibrio blakemorei]
MMPGVFVMLWSTGFLGAKLGLPYVEPFTFLLLRFLILTVILVAAAFVLRAPWPSTWAEFMRLGIVGLLVHGIYLGGVFSSIHAGLPAGVAALIVGLQPLLTAVGAGPFLGEKVTPRQWLGLALGLLGVALVLGEKLHFDQTGLQATGFAVAALFGITGGTIYQKRHGGGMDLRTGSAVQYAVAAVPMAVLAWLFESGDIQWSGELIFALGWLVVVLSIGAISLLYILIRRGAASKVASLFYLTPAVTAVLAWILFDETLAPLAIAGMAVTVVGVALVTQNQNNKPKGNSL